MQAPHGTTIVTPLRPTPTRPGDSGLPELRRPRRTAVRCRRQRLGALLGLLLYCLPIHAVLPIYEVVEVTALTHPTTLRGAGPNGHLVGDTSREGLLLPFVATADEGLRLLPLPDGYLTGTALDVNRSGLVVGAVSATTVPFDLGEPAIWLPDGAGGYAVVIPEQFDTIEGPFGPMSVSGGMAVAVNDDGVVVGWSRFSGFQGGPPTRFFATGAPLDLRTLGFEGTVRDLSNTGFVVGGNQRLNLTTGDVFELGLPEPLEGNVGFNQVIAFAVNDSGEMVVAADLASVSTENYLTYLRSDEAWTRLNPNELPARFVGFYDNNDLGDVSSTGGLLFRHENALFMDPGILLEQSSAHWEPALGFLDNERRMATTARDTQRGMDALVLLVPTNTSLFADGFEGGDTSRWDSPEL